MIRQHFIATANNENDVRTRFRNQISSRSNELIPRVLSRGRDQERVIDLDFPINILRGHSLLLETDR